MADKKDQKTKCGECGQFMPHHDRTAHAPHIVRDVKEVLTEFHDEALVLSLSHDMTLDLAAGVITKTDVACVLSPTETKLMAALVMAKRPLSRDALWEVLYSRRGASQEPRSLAVDDWILRLRRKLGNLPYKIESKSGLGWRLIRC